MNSLSLLSTPTMGYVAYMELFEQMVATGRTTGPNQSEAMLHYTKLNLKRMQRLNKTVVPSEALLTAIAAVPFEMRWVVITEIWCGDAAQNLPYIAALARLLPKVSLELVLRDENVAYTDAHLTNGSRSIPKVIIYRASDAKEIATWGPRPAEVQNKVLEYKTMPGEKPSFDEFAIGIHQWYTANRNQALESELLATFEILTRPVTAH